MVRRGGDVARSEAGVYMFHAGVNGLKAKKSRIFFLFLKGFCFLFVSNGMK